MLIAQKLNKILGVNAKHALYSEDGKWYHQLKDFPGALFDKNGKIIFETKEEYEGNNLLRRSKDLNIPEGISTITGYQFFTEQERTKINLIGLTFIDEASAWTLFIQAAREYEAAKEIFVSPSEHRKYLITNTSRNVVKIDRVETPNSYETIGRDKFRTCIKRINESSFPINKGSIYEHVVEEATIVELLPMLDWSESGNKISFVNDAFYLTNEEELPEAKNDDISKKMTVSLNVRRGQKKLREKLFYLYGGKCILSNCNIKEVLHACHITGFAVSGENMSTNALLLRSDLHDLFDANLLAINPDTKKVSLHVSLLNTVYKEFSGKQIKPRIDKKELNVVGLKQRWTLFNKKSSLYQ